MEKRVFILSTQALVAKIIQLGIFLKLKKIKILKAFLFTEISWVSVHVIILYIQQKSQQQR